MSNLKNLFSEVKSSVDAIHAPKSPEEKLNSAKLRNWMGATNVVVPLMKLQVFTQASIDGVSLKATAARSGQLAFAMLSHAISAGCPITIENAPGLYRNQLSCSARLLSRIPQKDIDDSMTGAILGAIKALYCVASSRQVQGIDKNTSSALQATLSDEQMGYLSKVLNSPTEYSKSLHIGLICSIHNMASSIYSSIADVTPSTISAHIPANAILTNTVTHLMNAWFVDSKSQLNVDFKSTDFDTLTKFIQNTSKLVSKSAQAVISDMANADTTSLMRPDFIEKFQRRMYPLLEELLSTTSSYANAIHKNNSVIYDRILSESHAPSPTKLSFDAWQTFVGVAGDAVVEGLTHNEHFTTVEDLSFVALELLGQSQKLTHHLEREVYQESIAPQRQRELLTASLGLVSLLRSKGYDISCDVAALPFIKPIAKFSQMAAKAVTPNLNMALDGVLGDSKAETVATHFALTHYLTLVKAVLLTQFNRDIANYALQSTISVISSSLSLYELYMKIGVNKDREDSLMIFESIFRSNSGYAVDELKRFISQVDTSHEAPLSFIKDNLTVNNRISAELEKIGRRNLVLSDFVARSFHSMQAKLEEASDYVKKPQPVPSVG